MDYKSFKSLSDGKRIAYITESVHNAKLTAYLTTLCGNLINDTLTAYKVANMGVAVDSCIELCKRWESINIDTIKMLKPLTSRPVEIAPVIEYIIDRLDVLKDKFTADPNVQVDIRYIFSVEQPKKMNIYHNPQWRRIYTIVDYVYTQLELARNDIENKLLKGEKTDGQDEDKTACKFTDHALKNIFQTLKDSRMIQGNVNTWVQMCRGEIDSVDDRQKLKWLDRNGKAQATLFFMLILIGVPDNKLLDVADKFFGVKPKNTRDIPSKQRADELRGKKYDLIAAIIENKGQ